jgi:putative transposase
MQIFHKPNDFEAFIKLLIQARQRAAPMDVLAFCLMPNHWHLVLRPKSDQDLARFMRWLCTAHVRRHHAHFRSPPGHLYQGRYKSFSVQNDGHLLTLLRYVEANALRAGLCQRADDWPWCSHAMRRGRRGGELLCDWPVDRPRHWSRWLEEAMKVSELEKLRTSVRRDRPYGSDEWVEQTAERLDLNFTLRPRGRPRGEGHKL